MSTAMTPAERARFLLALRDDPDFRDEVRNLLLGEELLQLPERFAQFAAYVHDFIEEQKKFNEDQRAINRRVERDLGILKGNAARRLLQLHHDTILEIFQLDFVRTLGRDDLSRMVRNSGIATQIEFGQRLSFYAAGLVLEGTDADGVTHYVAAWLRRRRSPPTTATPTAPDETPNFSPSSPGVPRAPWWPACQTTTRCRNWWTPALSAGSSRMLENSKPTSGLFSSALPSGTLTTTLSNRSERTCRSRPSYRGRFAHHRRAVCRPDRPQPSVAHVRRILGVLSRQRGI